MNAERANAILAVMAGESHFSATPGRIGYLAGFPRTKRMDTGARSTLMALRERGLVDAYRGPGRHGADYWFITDEGRKFLETEQGQTRRSDPDPKPVERLGEV